MKKLQVVIVEDEPATARNLAHLLNRADANITIMSTLNSVAEGEIWFNENTGNYDLAFMDIRLADGLSFDLFKKATITRPVIFVTAYNDYAIQAFKNNGIDYILKPFDEQEIGKALDKYKLLAGAGSEVGSASITALITQFNALTKSYKKSFLVHFRDKLVPVESAKISWFYTANEIVYAHTTDGHQYVMEYTMEQLEDQLDPQIFFRSNRQFIVNRNTITEVEFFFNSRLLIKIKPEAPERILVSKARASEFKSWMNQ